MSAQQRLRLRLQPRKRELVVGRSSLSCLHLFLSVRLAHSSGQCKHRRVFTTARTERALELYCLIKLIQFKIF